MRKARIQGALVGVESVTEEGLKDVYKGFNLAGDALAERLQTFKEHGIYVLASFIFGLPSDRPETFDATSALAERAGVTFAQFVTLTPFPGTIDFERWEKEKSGAYEAVDGVPASRYWLIPRSKRPPLYTAAPGDVPRRDPDPDAADLGPVLHAAPHLDARAHAEQPARPAGVRPDFEALPPDVREHRAHHRLGAHGALRAHGPRARAHVPAAVPHDAAARTAVRRHDRDAEPGQRELAGR